MKQAEGKRQKMSPSLRSILDAIDSLPYDEAKMVAEKALEVVHKHELQIVKSMCSNGLPLTLQMFHLMCGQSSFLFSLLLFARH